MENGKLRVIAAGLWLAGMASAGAADQASLSSSINLSRAASGEWRLEARQASLPKLLDEIAARTAAMLHYTVLPEVPVDATCVAASLEPLLRCLLGSGVNMAFHQARPEKAGAARTEEVWIMGSSLVKASAAKGGCPVAVAPTAGSAEPTKPDSTEQWLKQAKAKDPAQRAQAIAELGGADPAFDAKVKATLQKALSDRDAQVRTQAIAAWASREGEAGAGEQLRQALNDGNADVRLMALDSIEQDAELLQQAAQDADEAVRQMAEMKLEQLSKQ